MDFSRFNGLTALLDFNAIPAGTYATAAITFGSATLGYLNTQTGTAPVIASMPATLTQSVININLASPFVVNAGDMDALTFDFDLRKSIQEDSNGQIFFNWSLLVPGQHISIGGPLSGAGNSQSVTAHRIALRHEGHENDGLAGVLFNIRGAWCRRIRTAASRCWWRAVWRNRSRYLQGGRARFGGGHFYPGSAGWVQRHFTVWLPESGARVPVLPEYVG